MEDEGNPFGQGLSIRRQIEAPSTEDNKDEPNPFGQGLKTVKSDKTSNEPTAWQKYQQMPWNEQLLQAADDMFTLWASGTMYGAGGPVASFAGNRKEYDQAIADARQRSGVPGVAAELGGAVFSPVTKAITGTGALLSEGARVAAPWLSRVLPTARAVGEGATMGGTGALLSGRPEDAKDEALMGAALPLALKAGAKVMAPALKTVQSYLTGLYPDVYTKAYEAGREGGIIQKAFKEGRKEGGGSVGALDVAKDYAMSKINLTDSVDLSPMAKRLAPLVRSFMTSDGMAKMNRGDIAKFNQLKDSYQYFRQFPATVESVDAFRRHLDSWATGKGKVAELARAMKQELAFAAGATDPRYMDIAMKFDKAKEAMSAATSSRKIMPPHLGSLVNVAGGATAGALGGFFSPASLMLLAPAAVAASPRGSTGAVNLMGKATGLLDQMGIDWSKLGLMEYQREKRTEQ